MRAQNAARQNFKSKVKINEKCCEKRIYNGRYSCHILMLKLNNKKCVFCHWKTIEIIGTYIIKNSILK